MQHQTLVQMLLLLLQEKGWMPRHIREDVADPVTLESQCLMEADQLLSEGRADLSHRMLLEANRFGMTSPACACRYAQACADIGDLTQARDIWLRLSRHSDPAVAQQAKEMLQTMNFTPETYMTPGAEAAEDEPQHQQPTTTSDQGNVKNQGSFDHGLLKARFREAVDLYGVGLRFVDPEKQEIPLESVLQEIIAARDEGHTKLSLRLIQEARSAGCSSLWLSENEARALVCEGREEEAVELWKALLQEEDEGIVNVAQEMLAMYEPRVQQVHNRTRTIEEVDQHLAQNESGEAIRLLTENILSDPDYLPYREKLTAALTEEKSSDSPDSDVGSQISQREAWLVGQDILLDALEEKIRVAGLVE